MELALVAAGAAVLAGTGYDVVAGCAVVATGAVGVVFGGDCTGSTVSAGFTGSATFSLAGAGFLTLALATCSSYYD